MQKTKIPIPAASCRVFRNFAEICRIPISLLYRKIDLTLEFEFIPAASSGDFKFKALLEPIHERKAFNSRKFLRIVRYESPFIRNGSSGN